jgi:LmbE family N-acetylglucosaminyl deacetylase
MNADTILVVAAHPDDEVLGCGGTVAKMAHAGAAVHVLILGEGVTARVEKRDDKDAPAIQSLDNECKTANRLLGVLDVYREYLADNRFDSLDLLDIIKKIEGYVNTVNPDVVFTQHGGDINIDHSITFRAVLTAVRPMQGIGVKALYAYEIPSSTEWSMQYVSPVFHPNTYIDITDTLEVKLQALKTYQSELRSFPHPRSVEGVRSLARYRGMTAGVEAAEAFELIWQRNDI